MNPTPYKIHRVLRQLNTGSTRPFACSIKAVLKYDCCEAPQAVYNELVAVRLAQTLHIPIASGLLTDKEGADSFASLHVGRSEEKLPALQKYQLKAVAERYPEEVAALTVFDIFIGNRDRLGNVMASLLGTHRIFGGIDHGMSLLSVEHEPAKSLARLGTDDLILYQHPFYLLVDVTRLAAWADRIAAADPRDIRECCLCTKAVGSVTSDLQQRLAQALQIRQSLLPGILSGNFGGLMPKITPVAAV